MLELGNGVDRYKPTLVFGKEEGKGNNAHRVWWGWLGKKTRLVA